jgi:hypothetical protein
MVHRELFDLVAAKEIASAVADTGDVHGAATLTPGGQHHRGAHVGEIAVQGRHVNDDGVGLDNGLTDELSGAILVRDIGEVLLQLARQDLNRLFAGDFPGLLTAHAVSHHANGQIGKLLYVDGIFVVFAIIAQESAFADIQRQGHGATSFTSSRPPKRERDRAAASYRQSGRPLLTWRLSYHD